MIVQFRKSLVLTAAVLFAGAFSSFAQTGSDTYLASLKAENARHAAVNVQLQKDRVDAVTQRENAETDCSSQTGTQRQTCMSTARTNYDATIRNIDKQQVTEDGTHEKNVIALVLSTDPSSAKPN